MGTTVLQVRRLEGGEMVECRFRGRSGGARKWQWIVDAFGEVTATFERLQNCSVLRPDGEETLGRGARLVLDWKTFAKVIACWERDEDVQAAIAECSLRIDGDGCPAEALEATRRWAAKHWPLMSKREDADSSVSG